MLDEYRSGGAVAIRLDSGQFRRHPDGDHIDQRSPVTQTMRWAPGPIEVIPWRRVLDGLIDEYDRVG